MFETNKGMLNIAPTKISGQYKIVIDSTLNLWLDDYTGRRVAVDKTKTFLPQVCNFLKTGTNLIDNKYLRFGGFQQTKQSWHIPLYLNSKDYPKYFVLTNVVNETIPKASINYLYEYSKILHLIDLQSIGIHNIFDEILNEKDFDYPLYLDWEEKRIDLFGLSIPTEQPTKYSFDMLDTISNQPFLQVLNNRILNTFTNQKIIFPKFINLEFEFSFESTLSNVSFINFNGFLSDQISVEQSQMVVDKLYTKIDIETNQTQVYKNNPFILDNYQHLLTTISLQEVAEQQPQIRLSVSRIETNNHWKIYHPDGTIFFEYYVPSELINISSLYQSLIAICKDATKKANRVFEFSVSTATANLTGKCILKIKSNIQDNLSEDYWINFPVYYEILDNLATHKKFRGITSNDVWVLNPAVQTTNLTTIKINNVDYNITESFKFDGNNILRLEDASQLTGTTLAEIYETLTQTLIEVSPIPFLDYNSTLTGLNSLEVYDVDQYINDLKTKFITTETPQEIIDLINITTDDFSLSTVDAIKQYIEDDGTNLNDTNQLNLNDYNTEIVMNMIFTTIGMTSYITPNILNVDKQFYLQNGNLDTNLLNSDLLRFNWFLIKGECPDYLLNDIRSNRYFTTTPSVMSKLIKITEGYCETVFLGVKYQFPGKYEGYSFATYLEFNTLTDTELSYKINVDDVSKTILLSINKYLDFADLIRGGVETNEPLLDLSFFYSVGKSYNSTSQTLFGFKSSGIKLFQPFEQTESIMFGNLLLHDFKYYDPLSAKWYVAIRRFYSAITGETNNFETLFPTSGDASFYVYSEIEYQGTVYQYKTVEVVVKSIKEVKPDYLWCEDIQLKFFDTPSLFLQKYNVDLEAMEVFNIPQDNIIAYEPVNDNVFGDYEQIATILLDDSFVQFRLLLHNKPISIKEYYFQINQVNSTRTLFKFPEFVIEGTDEELITYFDGELDESVTEQQITLFDRNQIWLIMQDLMLIDVKFQYLSESQVKSLINNFMITNLVDYTELTSLPIENKPDEYIKITIFDNDRNLVNWNINNNYNLVMVNRIKTAYFPFFVTTDEYNFQLSQFKQNQTLFNIYDSNFGGTGIVATGIWNEVQGNIVSSLYCKSKDIEVSLIYSQEFDYQKALANSLNIDECLINGNNQQYITQFNANINEYIKESYSKYLLDNFYSLNYIVDSNNNRLEYSVNQGTIIRLNYNANIKLVFKRK